ESLAAILLALVDPVVAPSEVREHLVADGAAGGSELVDADIAADQGDEIAAAGAAFGEIGHVDREEVHGDAAGERAMPPGDDHLRGGLAFGGAGGALVAVAIA